MAYTRGNLKTMIKQRLSVDNFEFFTETDLNTILDDSHEQVIIDAKLNEKTMKSSVTVSKREYALPSNFLELLQVQWKKIPIPIVESDWLDEHDEDWRDTTGGAVSHATIENGNLSLYPTPNTTAAALTTPLRIKVRRSPAAFSDDNSTIEMSDYLAKVLLDYAESLAWEGYDKSKAEKKLADYERRISKLKPLTITPEGPKAQRRGKFTTGKDHWDNY